MKAPKWSRSSLFWSGVTATAGVVVTVYLLPIELAIITLMVLFCHELAHYVTAWLLDAEPEWPIIIPLGIFTIGWTKVKHIKVQHVRTIALSGPIVGAILSIFALLLGWALHSHLVVIGAVWTLLFEIYAGTLGSDGRHARKGTKNKVRGYT